jgi:hypothetical protein
MTDAEKIIVGVLVILAICCVVAIMLGAALGEVADQMNPHDEEGEQ